MWECNYGKEPLDLKLLTLRLLRRAWVVLLAAALGALLVGGPYFLKKVTFGPAREYEAVTDFYMDYAVQETGEEYVYFNQTTWTQLITDDVFTDKILAYMAGMDFEADMLQEIEAEAGITKAELREYLYATMLSDTRIVTTTVTTNSPELTMRINEALIHAMFSFGEEQKEIAAVRILQEPSEASLVVADIRTFRACMVGVVSFVFVTLLYMLLYYVLDDSIYIPTTFEYRYGIPMLGTMESLELEKNGRVLLKKQEQEIKLLAVDKEINLPKAKEALEEKGFRVSAEEAESGDAVLLLVKAGAHNGKIIEKTLSLCRIREISPVAAVLWDADEKLIKAYEMPAHAFHAWHGEKKKS